MWKRLRSSSSLHMSSQGGGDLQLYGDISTGKFRPLVHTGLHDQVFDKLHGVAVQAKGSCGLT
jgi:hypothetical protein